MIGTYCGFLTFFGDRVWPCIYILYGWAFTDGFERPLIKALLLSCGGLLLKTLGSLWLTDLSLYPPWVFCCDPLFYEAFSVTCLLMPVLEAMSCLLNLKLFPLPWAAAFFWRFLLEPFAPAWTPWLCIIKFISMFYC